MAVVTKPGARLRSVTCTTEVVVVKGVAEPVDLRCGGEPMVDIGAVAVPAQGVVAPFGGGTLVGKRYVSADESLEVLCTKAGSGSLSLGEDLLTIRGAKPLPASD
jgi:hypothetical protein